MDTLCINASNLGFAVDLLDKEFDDCYEKFEKVEDSISLLKRSSRSDRSKINSVVDEINESLLDKLDQLYKFNSIEKKHIDNFDSKLMELNAVQDKYRTRFNTVIQNFTSLKESILKKSTKLQENQASRDNKRNQSNTPNPFILQSRQTKEPFVIAIMKPGIKSRCDGCKKAIVHQDMYLQHDEEYPAGTKVFRQHGYHIRQNCLISRGFEMNYINESRVISDEIINKTLFEDLKKIGFEEENISMTRENLVPSQSVESIDTALSDSQSNTSTTPSVASLEPSHIVFNYCRKPPHMKNLICEGCSLNINEDAYLIYGNANSRAAQYHIRKACLRNGGVATDMSFVRCIVRRLLKTHDEIKQLISCGFYYKNIIGFRPENPIKKNSAPRNPKPPINIQAPPVQDMGFIFNNEPFIHEKLVNSEKCRGCNKSIQRGNTALRHKERVARDRLENPPLISQWYHVSIECLRARGFTNKYLSSIKCNINWHSDDKHSQISDLVKCGFYHENLNDNFTETQETMGFQVESRPELKLFVNSSDNSSAKCQGCGYQLTPGQTCFIYGYTPVQDSNAKTFHIRRSCLENCFTKSELRSMACITINMEAVSPNEIINCGICNIVSDCNFVNSSKTIRDVRENRPQKPKWKPMSFKVDIIDNRKSICCSCKKQIPLDKYTLKIENPRAADSLVHLDVVCVGNLDIPRRHLANYKVSSNVYLPFDIIEELKKCGFRNFPKD